MKTIRNAILLAVAVWLLWFATASAQVVQLHGYEQDCTTGFT